MENQKQQHIGYSSVSRNESHLLRLVEENDLLIFGVKELRSLSSWDKTRIHNTLFSLERKGRITKLKRDCYALEGSAGERLFEIATEAVKPSYISFWTALSFHGFTEQQPRVVQLVSTKQVHDIEFGSQRIQATIFLPKRFYGYRRVGRFVMAEKEKALVDSLYQPDKCGGLEEFAKCLRNAWEHLDKEKLLEYIIRFDNRSLVSRAGYMMDGLGLEGDKIKRILKAHRSDGYIRLDPKEQTILRYDRRWRVIVNRDIEWEEHR